MDIITNIFSTPIKRDFLWKMFSSLLFLPILRPDILLIVAPSIAKNLLSNVPTNHSIYWHYTATMIPFFVISLIFSFKKVTNYFKTKHFLLLLIGGVLIAEIFLGALFLKNASKSNLLFTIPHYPVTTQDIAKSSAVSLIPKNASCITTFDFMPKLSMRKKINTFYTWWRGYYHDKGLNPEYAIVDFNDYFLRKDLFYFYNQISDLFLPFLTGENWKPISQESDIIVFQKTNKSTPSDALIKINFTPTPNTQDLKPILTIDNAINLLDYTIETDREERKVNMTFTWTFSKKIRTIYDLYFVVNVSGKEEVVQTHTFLYCLNPNNFNPGDIVTERYSLLLPGKYDPEDISLTIDFINIPSRERAGVTPLKEKYLDKNNRLLIL